MINPMAIQRHIDESILPFKHSYVELDNLWSLQDTEHRYLLSSDKYAQLYGYVNHRALQGQRLLPSEQLSSSDLKQINLHEQHVIDTSRSCRGALFFRAGESVNVYAMTITPVFYSGLVVALDKKLTFLARHNFNLHRLDGVSPALQKIRLVTKSYQEELVIYLLILNRTQHQIASYLGVSRSRVVQIITRLSNQLGISGCSSKFLINQAVVNGYHKKIPPELYLLVSQD